MGERVYDEQVRAQASEKLLNALISVLALRDPALLAELKIIFATARALHRRDGPEVWECAEQQLGAIAAVVLRPDRDKGEGAAGQLQPH